MDGSNTTRGGSRHGADAYIANQECLQPPVNRRDNDGPASKSSAQTNLRVSYFDPVAAHYTITTLVSEGMNHQCLAPCIFHMCMLRAGDQ